jgi:2-keto-3-deoxy-6-phosphogluconate aldolase
MPSGGVSLDNLEDWYNKGAYAVGIGTPPEGINSICGIGPCTFFMKFAPSKSPGNNLTKSTPDSIACILNGAEYIVSPHLDIEIAKMCNRYAVPYLPGCGSVTERYAT